MMLTTYPGVFCPGHILFLLFWIILTVISVVLIKKTPIILKSQTLIIKIIALILLVFILINRFTITYYSIYIEPLDNANWSNLLPSTFCGLSSIVLALCVLIGKKDNIILHAVSYSSLIGGIISLVYPTYLNTQTFADIRTITGLVHHAIGVSLVVIMLATKYFVPTLKKWYAYPLGICVTMTLGIFELDALNFTSSMQIFEPFVTNVTISSWYIIVPMTIIVQLIICYIFDKINKKSH